jgi:hypothetical protein
MKPAYSYDGNPYVFVVWYKDTAFREGVQGTVL